MTDPASKTAPPQGLKRGDQAIMKSLSERKDLLPLSGDKSTTLSSHKSPDLDQRSSKRVRRV